MGYYASSGVIAGVHFAAGIDKNIAGEIELTG